MTSGTFSSFSLSSQSKFCSSLPLAISAQEAIVHTFSADWGAIHVCTLPEMVWVMGELGASTSQIRRGVEVGSAQEALSPQKRSSAQITGEMRAHLESDG